jgi:serine/threonine protein phosphatase PrpC
MVDNPQLRDQHLREAFRITEDKLEQLSKIDSMFSGSTAVVVLMWNNILLCGNAGDSRAIVCSQN